MKIISKKGVQVLVFLLPFLLLVSGCSGTKILKEPVARQTTDILGSVSNNSVEALLDWVVVRDGPGTWAKNADWDEYLIRIENRSDQTIIITRLKVQDFLETWNEPGANRKALVKASKQNAKRFKDADIKVKAGFGTTTMMGTGALITAAGLGVAEGAATASLVAGSTSAASTGVILASGLLLAGPVLAVGGVLRGINNGAVNNEIKRRHTSLPIEVAAGEVLQLDVFFPLVPSPLSVEFTYSDPNGEHTLVLDTRNALAGLHITE